MFSFSWIMPLSVWIGCAPASVVPVDSDVDNASANDDDDGTEGEGAEDAEEQTNGADVVGVTETGKPGAYVFSVSLLSHDTGCDHYADWWEVIDPSGVLIYRRILNHSHPDEQPFTRSGEAMDVSASQVLIVRGHMNETGYGGMAYSGTILSGFAEAPDIGADFAAGVENEGEQPEDCWY